MPLTISDLNKSAASKYQLFINSIDVFLKHHCPKFVAPQKRLAEASVGRKCGFRGVLPQAETSSRKNPASGLRLANLRLRLCLLQGLKSKDECGCAKIWPNFRDFLRHLLESKSCHVSCKMLEIASAATDPSKFRSFGTSLQWSMSARCFRIQPSTT